jgi:hypothetical protein
MLVTYNRAISIFFSKVKKALANCSPSVQCQPGLPHPPRAGPERLTSKGRLDDLIRQYAMSHIAKRLFGTDLPVAGIAQKVRRSSVQAAMALDWGRTRVTVGLGGGRRDVWGVGGVDGDHLVGGSVRDVGRRAHGS